MLREQDFEMYSGDTKALIVTTTDDDQAVDLAGATVKWILRGIPGASNLISKTNTNGITILPGGQFQVNLLPADTASLAGVYHHEAEMTDSLGQISTIMVGKARIRTGYVT